MKKLFRVNIEFDTIVEAESAEEAEKMTEDIIKDSDERASFVSARPLNGIEDLPGEWNGECYPWGSDEERNINTILRGEHVRD